MGKNIESICSTGWHGKLLGWELPLLLKNSQYESGKKNEMNDSMKFYRWCTVTRMFVSGCMFLLIEPGMGWGNA